MTRLLTDRQYQVMNLVASTATAMAAAMADLQ